jgi:PAS domain S-box-containing protein
LRDIAEPAANSAAKDHGDGVSDPDDQLSDRDTAVFRHHADALFGDAPDGITIQHGGRIVYANRRMAALTGHSDPAHLIGASSLHLYSEDDLASVLARLQSTYFGRPTPPMRHRIQRTDGEQIEVEVSCLLLTLASTRMLVEVARTREATRREVRQVRSARDDQTSVA